jgi:hypothetical protein
MAELTAIELDGDELLLVCGETRGADVVVRRALTLAVPEHASDAAGRSAWFTHELRGLDWPKTPCVFLFPRDEAILRRLEVPDVPDGELAPLVRFQAAAKFSGGIETLALDYLPLARTEGSTGKSVLAVTVPQALVAEFDALCRMGQLSPVGASIVPIATGEVALAGEAAPSTGQRLLIAEHGGRVEISLFDGPTLVYSHWARPGDAAPGQVPQVLAGEVARTLVAARQTLPALALSQVWLLLETVDPSVLGPLLSQRLDCPVQPVAAPPTLRWEVTDLPLATALARYAGPIGALLAQSRPRVTAVNFLAPRKLIEKPDPRRRRYAILGGGIAAAALVWTGLTVSEFSDLDRRIGIERSGRDQTKEVLDKGDARLKSMQAVEAWLKGQPQWLDEWKELLATLPKTDRLYIKSIRFEPNTRPGSGRIALEGYARERSDVLQLTERLVAAGEQYEVAPPVAAESKDDNFYPWKVSVAVTLRPPVTKKTAPKS